MNNICRGTRLASLGDFAGRRIRMRRVVFGDKSDEATAPQTSSNTKESSMRCHIPTRKGGLSKLARADVELRGQYGGGGGAQTRS